MGFIKATFQSMHQLQAKAELCQYMMVALVCKDDFCNCSGRKRQLYCRDMIVGTQLVAGAFNKEHQVKLLSETASLHSLEDKLDRLCAACWRSWKLPPPRSVG